MFAKVPVQGFPVYKINHLVDILQLLSGVRFTCIIFDLDLYLATSLLCVCKQQRL